MTGDWQFYVRTDDHFNPYIAGDDDITVDGWHYIAESRIWIREDWEHDPRMRELSGGAKDVFIRSLALSNRYGTSTVNWWDMLCCRDVIYSNVHHWLNPDDLILCAVELGHARLWAGELVGPWTIAEGFTP